MHILSSRTAGPFLVLAAIALGACGDQAKLVQPPPNPEHFVVCGPGCGGGGGGGGGGSPPPAPPAITGVSNPPGTMDKAGFAVSFGVSLSNGQSAYSNVSVSSRVITSSGTYSTGSQLVSCGLSLGTLPTGTCSINASAAFAAGVGPGGTGPATFEVDLYSGFTFLASKTFGVSVVDSRPTVTGSSMTGTTLLIGGPSKSFTATVVNPGVGRSNISVRAYVSQGSAIRYSTPSLVNCGSGAGVLPNGNCLASGTYFASNTAQGTGTLIAGPANFGVQILDAGGNVLGGGFVNGTLAAFPTIVSVTPSGAAFLNGPAAADTVVIQNGGQAISGVVVQATIIQNGTSRALASQSLSCAGGTSGNLPNGSCKFTGSFAATDPLVVGAANLQVQLSDPVDGVLATQTVPITIGQVPQIDVFLNNTTLVIDGTTPVGYTASLSNPGGPNLSNAMTVKAVLTQSGGVSRTLDSKPVKCNGGADGIPANGSCSVPGGLTVTSAGGTGTLMPGQPAILQFQVIDNASGVSVATFATSVNLQSM
jgi:hypothetical protein